jgi:cell division protein FtsI/penicillin-binding protein 2
MRRSSFSDYSRFSKKRSHSKNTNISFASKIYSKLNKIFAKSPKKQTKFVRQKSQSNTSDLKKYKETYLVKLTKKISHFAPRFFLFCGYVISLPIMLIMSGFVKIISLVSKQKTSRVLYAKVGVVLVFASIFIQFARLQVLPYTTDQFSNDLTNIFREQVVPSSRGNIYITDREKNVSNIELTSTKTVFTIYIDPTVLKSEADTKKNNLSLEQYAEIVSGSMNASYTEILEKFKTAINEKPIKKYVPIQKQASLETKKAIEFLINPPLDKNDEFRDNIPPFRNWLGVDGMELRMYPRDSMLAGTLGYVLNQQVPRSEIINSKTECAQVALENDKRGTGREQYSMGYYGIEQRFCKELSGLNGKKVFNKDKGLEREANFRAVNGNNIYLTIDQNIQQKAEEVLAQAMRRNTSKLGAPTNGFVGIMEAKTGKILGMAMSPSFNPNEQKFIFTDPEFDNPFTNIAGRPYEIGSVMKPLTVAAAMNEYQSGKTDENGNRKGVPTDWKGGKAGKEGKRYEEKNKNGTVNVTRVIQNADGYVYGENQSLSNILRDSINTGIADIVPTIGNKNLKSYITDTFKFGSPTQVNLPGEDKGNLFELKNENNIFCDFCFANYGFGQGFSASPLQLMRAYTPIATDGKLVEPYLFEKIVDEDGNVIDDGTKEGSKIYRKPSQQVIDPDVARDVTNYLINTTEEGYHGDREVGVKLDGYFLAGKTGTAQIGNKAKYTGECPDKAFYLCNTTKGLYEHTYVGYGPGTNPEYIIVIKVAEPQPGVGAKNFAVTTLKESIKDMSQFTFEYMKAPKDKK